MKPNLLSSKGADLTTPQAAARRVRFVRVVTVLVLVACVTLMTAPGVGYARPEPPGEINSPAHVEDDGGIAEMGVEWITDWPGTSADRPNWYYSANYLYAELLNRGWIGRFNWGNTNAWERDFKRAASGGNGLIDSVDLAMIGTHGTSAYDSFWGKNLSAVYFSSNNDDWYLSPGEAYHYYGTSDLEWLIFDSCSVLRDDSMAYWHATFNGLHQMLGFANTMYVVYPGDGGVFADRARYKGWWHPAQTVTQAWFSAVSNQQPSGVKARVLAEELNNYNDYLWGEGYVSPDYPNNGGYWYWDHWSGSPAPLQLTAAAPISLPVYTIVTRTVDLTYTARIGQVFGLTDTTKIHQDGSTFYMVDAEAPQPPSPPPTLQASAAVTPTKLLVVDMASGGFFFQNLGELWTHPEMPRSLPPSGARAEFLASSFLQKNGESLPGYYGYHTIVTPTIELEGATNGPTIGATVIAASTPTSPTNYAIDYARAVDIGGGQMLSVVGPGSHLNVYLGNNNQVIGLQGGWRREMPAQMNVGAQSTAAVTVPIKTSDQAWADFLANPHIALAQPPLASTYVLTSPAPTLAYYEQVSTIGQAELIPVWVFVADLYTATTSSQVQVQSTQAITPVLVASDVNLYVPAEASPTAMPQASIISPTVGTIIVPGTSLVLNGAATGGTAPYTFQWSSSEDGLLGTGATLTSPGLHAFLHDGSLAPNAITLSVTDANGLQSTATVNVTVLGRQLYLPIILKQQ
jgi:hypothetical protein